MYYQDLSGPLKIVLYFAIVELRPLVHLFFEFY